MQNSCSLDNSIQSNNIKAFQARLSKFCQPVHVKPSAHYVAKVEWNFSQFNMKNGFVFWVTSFWPNNTVKEIAGGCKILL